MTDSAAKRMTDPQHVHEEEEEQGAGGRSHGGSGVGGEAGFDTDVDMAAGNAAGENRSNNATTTEIISAQTPSPSSSSMYRANGDEGGERGSKRMKNQWPLLATRPDMEPTPSAMQELNQAWQVIRSLLSKVESFTEDRQLRGKVPWTMQEYTIAYSSTYDLFVSPSSNYFEASLYENYTLYIKEYLTNRVRPILHGVEGLSMLTDITSVWRNYKDVFVRLCAKIFSYLDKFYVDTASKRTLHAEASYLFKTVVFDSMKADVRCVVLENIDADRKGHMANRSLLRETLLLFHDLDVQDGDDYEKDFERYAAQETKDFFKALSDELIVNATLTEYMIAVEARINEEIGRLSAIFPNTSQKKLMRLVDEQLLVVKQKQLLEMSGSGVETLVREEKFDDLSRLFRMFSRIEDGLIPIANFFRDHIASVGDDLYRRHLQNVSPLKEYNKMAKALIDSYVGDLLALHEHMENIVRRSFSSSTVFHKALADGFKQFVNQNFKCAGSKMELRCVQLFAYYCDELLRRKSETPESTLDKVVKFIQFFNEKDIFIEEYKKQLSKRLLTGVDATSESDEKSVISKLKYFYQGIGDIYKLEKMLADKAMASEMKHDFDNYVQKNNMEIPFDLSVTVLTMGTWPISGSDPLKPPAEFTSAQKIFKAFYDERSNNRTLNWVHSRGVVTMTALYENGKKILDLTAYQATVLLLFNSSEKVSFAQISETTAIPDDELKRTMASFTHKGWDVLRVLDKGNEIQDKKDTMNTASESGSKNEGSQCGRFYVVNTAFAHKKTKIKIPLPRFTEEESSKTVDTVSGDRTYVLEAAIVRIMKLRKKLKVQELIMEVLSHVSERFQPQVKAIKKRVDGLIEREYLKRDESNAQMLIYMA